MLKASYMAFGLQLVVIALLGISALSCSQYEYASPSPGILEVRLNVRNSRTDLIPFVQGNQFHLVLRELEAKKPDGVRLRILSDLSAIRRYKDGDSLNCLSPAARDSQMVLGIVYAPPATFTSLELRIQPVPFVVVVNNLVPSFIPVLQPPTVISDLQRLPANGTEANITITENRRTLVIVTLDLDATLVRRTEWFEYHPTLTISSIRNF